MNVNGVYAACLILVAFIIGLAFAGGVYAGWMIW